jgi:hypothetical protein
MRTLKQVNVLILSGIKIRDTKIDTILCLSDLDAFIISFRSGYKKV